MENENNNVPNTTDQVSAMDAVTNTLEQPAEPTIGVIPADASAEATPVAPETPAEPVVEPQPVEAPVEAAPAPVEGAPVEAAPVEGAPVEAPTPVEGMPAEAPVEVGVVSPDGTEAPVEAPKKSKLPLIIIIVVVLLAAAAAVYFLFLKKDEEEKPVENTTKPAENTTVPEEKTLEELVADYLVFLGDGYLTVPADEVDGDKTKDETGIECKAITYEDLAAMQKANEANETNETNATTEDNATTEEGNTTEEAKTGETGYFACKKAPDPVDSVAINKTKETEKAVEYDKELQLTAACTSARKEEKCEDNLKWSSNNTKVATVDEKTGKVKNVNTDAKETEETSVVITVKYAEKSDTITLKMKGGKKEEKPAETNTTPATPTTPTTPTVDYSNCVDEADPEVMLPSKKKKLENDMKDWTLEYVNNNCPTLNDLKTVVANEAERIAEKEFVCPPSVVAKAKSEAIDSQKGHLLDPDNLETLRLKYQDGKVCAGKTFE